VPALEAVASEYDKGRPAYPAGVYNALGPLEGLTVLDVGAGTGIATRQLLQRRARVVAVDRGEHILEKAVARTRGLAAIIADGLHLPVRDQTVDLVCFAQAWHWLDSATRVGEMHRVLRPGGRWAGWWSHARADSKAWFDAYWSAIEAGCPGTHRDQRDTDWGRTVDDPGMFKVASRVVVPWTRTVSTDEWFIDQASHSYVAALGTVARDALLSELRRIVEAEFGDATMTVPYETWLWTATKSA
jgi:SAM-dependent methyltransferase